ncbi:uncharacterized protein wu:fc21g02 isoform X1 [Oryzias melastigma]|uniref:uncharacterized protein wu:fc21g02 isoform X1 n=1 Tax=Oryzias melastigma TaxID=30732 RepID=UPI00168D0AC7|nr:uncharacterized protein wu:fc21g02 isoform X1 [Oryzias melastigma]XP_036069906.1 uncharacterized protein wu:fc21g02 isoform X1 [Oryzias melastigma]
MFLTLFAVFYVLFGSSCGLSEKSRCYGDSVDLDSFSLNKKLYFHPERGRKILLMNNREAMDPRLKVSTNSVKLTQLTEKDNGKFSVSIYYGKVLYILLLTVLDCTTNISLFYGEELVHNVPSNAELLEFTPVHGVEEPQLLWERENPQNHSRTRRKVSENVFIISKVTQEDNGDYNFRQEDSSLVKQLRLSVKENTSYYDFEEYEDVFFPFPWGTGNFTVTFKPQDREENATIIRAGSVVRSSNPFYHRITIKNFGIDISHVECSDAGTFEFRDSAGNLALIYYVNITESHHSSSNLSVKVVDVSVVVPVVVAILGLLCCCCYCCKKYCCKKTKPPSPVAQTLIDPKVYYHAYQPINEETNISQPGVVLRASDKSAPSSSSGNNPPSSDYQPAFETHQPTHEVKNISQPEVTSQASKKSAPSSSFGYNPLSSSDYQPIFLVKGLNSTFYLPLSTEPCFTDVFNSDKMNFL